MKPILKDQAAAIPSGIPSETDTAPAPASFSAKLTTIIKAASEFGGKAKTPTVQAAEKTNPSDGSQRPLSGAGDVRQSSTTPEVNEPDAPARTASSVSASVSGPVPSTLATVADAPSSSRKLNSRLSVVPAAHIGTAMNVPAKDTSVNLTAVARTVALTTLPDAALIDQPQMTMSPNTPLSLLESSGRAIAQLTLGFEIVSMQLTSSFRLGSVELKALSDVVSLHLITTQPEEKPLAAGISFEIEHVELDGSSDLKCVLLKPLDKSREMMAPIPQIKIDHMTVASDWEGAPISVITSGQAASAVQLLGTFAVVAIDFTPSFEIGALRLEPTSRTVLLHVAPSTHPVAVDLPPSFDITKVELGTGARFDRLRVVPKETKPV